MAGAKKSAANPFFKSKYANLEEVISVVKAAFAENGLSFVQFPISTEGHAGVETIILHESGEFISNEFMLKCAKTDPQGMGSAITYARRYGLQSAAGIPSEDDDGNAASAPDPTPAPEKPKSKEERFIEILQRDAAEEWKVVGWPFGGANKGKTLFDVADSGDSESIVNAITYIESLGKFLQRAAVLRQYEAARAHTETL